MSKVYTVEWVAGPSASPQESCANAMKGRHPWVLTLTFRASAGDMLMFPAFFVSYPVLRMAKPGERVLAGGKGRCYVVCAEPPQERSESVAVEDLISIAEDAR